MTIRTPRTAGAQPQPTGGPGRGQDYEHRAADPGGGGRSNHGGGGYAAFDGGPPSKSGPSFAQPYGAALPPPARDGIGPMAVLAGLGLAAVLILLVVLIRIQQDTRNTLDQLSRDTASSDAAILNALGQIQMQNRDLAAQNTRMEGEVLSLKGTVEDLSTNVYVLRYADRSTVIDGVDESSSGGTSTSGSSSSRRSSTGGTSRTDPTGGSTSVNDSISVNHSEHSGSAVDESGFVRTSTPVVVPNVAQPAHQAKHHFWGDLLRNILIALAVLLAIAVLWFLIRGFLNLFRDWRRYRLPQERYDAF